MVGETLWNSRTIRVLKEQLLFGILRSLESLRDAKLHVSNVNVVLVLSFD